MFGDRRRVRAAAELLRRWGIAAPGPAETQSALHAPQLPVERPPGPGSTLAAMDGDVNQTLGELERRLKELERELEAVGRAGEVDAEPAQGGWTPPSGDTGVAPPPPGTTPFTASWSGTGAAETAGEPTPPPTPQGAPPIPVRPPYWQPVTPPAAEPAAAETPAAAVRWSPPEQPAPAPQPRAPERAHTAPEPPAAAPAAAPQQATPAPAEPPTSPAGPTPPAEPTATTAGLHRQLDELLAFRERLVTSTNQLVDELSRVLDELGVELQAEEPAQPDPAETVLSGDVVVEAGPFGDLATLAAFEQALQRTDGVARVHVRTLDEGHATIDVALEEPTRLAAALRERAVIGFEITDVSESRLVLAVA